MKLQFKVNADAIAQEFKALALEVSQDLTRSMGDLAAMTHAKVQEMASAELHSSLQTLQDNLNFEEIASGVWVVSIDQDALWIEEGIEKNHDMKPDLLKNNAKVSKDGFRYKSIPFKHGGAPSQMTPHAKNLVAQIRSELKKQNIPFKKIEKDAAGNPRLGQLHKLDIPSELPTSRASSPALAGVKIYQSQGATGNVRRDILTFRTVSSNPASQGKWVHPGLVPKKFLDRALAWAEKEWEMNVLPQVLGKWGK